MLDLQQAAVIDWLNVIDPARPESEWPPAVRLIETEAGAPELFEDLGRLLNEFGNDRSDALARTLRTDEPAHLLRDILAQVGAARLFRLLHWLGERDVFESHLIVAALLEGASDEARALRAAIAAFTRRALLVRLFAPDRLAVLQSATEIALKEIA
jgi:hypothetical protein